MAQPLRAPGQPSPTIHVRLVRPDDAPGLAALYAALSAESRRLRFLGSTTHDPDALLACCAPDHRRAEGFVAEVRGGDADGAIVGHLELVPGPHGSTEIAIAVADAHQHRGIGRQLLAAGLAWAREHHLHHLSATAFADNASVLGLFRGSLPGMRVIDLWDGTVEIDADGPVDPA